MVMADLVVLEFRSNERFKKVSIMAGIIIPVSLTTEQANLIMELIKRRVQIIEGSQKGWSYDR